MLLTISMAELLAYVWAGSTLVNESMVRDGWAVLYTVPPNVKYADRLGTGARRGPCTAHGPLVSTRLSTVYPAISAGVAASAHLEVLHHAVSEMRLSVLLIGIKANEAVVARRQIGGE